MRGALKDSVGYPTCAINVVLPLIMPPSSISRPHLTLSAGTSIRDPGRSTIQQGHGVGRKGASTLAKTRIAVAGAGYIGHAHMDVAQKSPTCALSAIVDPAPAAQAIAAEAGVPLYRTLDELFAKDRPDGVILATPNQLHVEHASLCIEAGLPMPARKADRVHGGGGRDGW